MYSYCVRSPPSIPEDLQTSKHPLPGRLFLRSLNCSGRIPNISQRSYAAGGDLLILLPEKETNTSPRGVLTTRAGWLRSAKGPFSESRSNVT